MGESERERASASGGAREHIRNDYERVNAAARRRTPAAIYEPRTGHNAETKPRADARYRARRKRAAHRFHGQLHRARRAINPHHVGRVRPAAVVQRPNTPAGDARRSFSVRLGAHYALQVQPERILACSAVDHAILLYGDAHAGDAHMGDAAQDRGAAGTWCVCVPVTAALLLRAVFCDRKYQHRSRASRHSAPHPATRCMRCSSPSPSRRSRASSCSCTSTTTTCRTWATSRAGRTARACTAWEL